MREAGLLRTTWFERHPTTTQVLAGLVVLSLAMLAVEMALRTVWGLGNPVLYDSNPLYGYRPLPNQSVARVRFNNLGLRCDHDWDGDVGGKILFLGDSVTYGGAYVANDETFSQLAVQGLDGYQGCNAGVNAWGVENIHGLLVESGFLPARYYVTVLIEDDFYRGLTRLQGQLVWCRRPACAVEEALFDFLHLRDESRRYLGWRWYGRPDVVAKVVDKAARKLLEVEQVLKSKGFDHLLYVSPMGGQLLANVPKDALVAQALARYGLQATYLLDAVQPLAPAAAQKSALFYDNVHLSKQGHALWARIINGDLRRLVPAR